MSSIDAYTRQFLTCFDSQTPQLTELLYAALQESDTFYARLSSDARQALARLVVDALRESVAQQSPTPLLEAVRAGDTDLTQPLDMASAQSPTLADIQALFNMARRNVFAALKSCEATDHTFIVEGVNFIADLLLQASALEAERRLAAQSADLHTFYALAENAPDGISVAGLDTRLTYANPAFRALTGYADIAGLAIRDLVAAEDAEQLPEMRQRIFEHGAWQGTVTYRRHDSSTLKVYLSAFMVRDAAGRPQALAAIVRDVSEQLRGEQERMALQEQVIAAQRAALRELSTPIIPLADDVVAMPLIGTIDSSRAQQVIESLLEGVAAHQAATAILDITGVPLVDTQVANALMHAARAVKLLGTQVVITGIRPEVAQTLVGLGVDLRDIVTRSTLQSGIAFALAGDRAEND